MKSFLNSVFVIVFFFVFTQKTQAQSAPVHVYNDALYSFLEELNTAGYSNETYIAKPLNTKQVSNILYGINLDSMQNETLKNRLVFYRQQFVLEHSDSYQTPTGVLKEPFKTLTRSKSLDWIYYGDGKVAFTLNPILGTELYSNKNGALYTTRKGGDFKMYLKNFTIYGNVREVYESRPTTSYTSIGPHEGQLYKLNADGSAEFSESRGGVSYQFGMGEIAFAKDHLKWGYGQFGTNILDASVPSYPHLKLRLYPKPWIKFEYAHASLQSNVIDSSSAYLVGNGMYTRYEFQNKYLATNLLSFRIKKKTWLSIGNSIVYAQRNPEPAYFIPMAFFKSIDHYIADRNNYRGGNAQMFAAFSTRIIPKTHFYSTLYVDEISVRRMFDKERSSNWFSINTGIQVSNVIPNTTFTVEYLHTNPMVYKHFIETTTYANSYYTLGSVLGDNARQVSFAAAYSPLWWLSLKGMYQFSQKGPDYIDLRGVRDPITGIPIVLGIPFIEKNAWIRNLYQVELIVSPLANFQVFVKLRYQNEPVINTLYDVPYYLGNNTTFAVGLRYGF